MKEFKLITEDKYLYKLRELALNSPELLDVNKIDLIEPLKALNYGKPTSNEKMFRHIFSNNLTNGQ
jgi:hypothetical protein